VLKLGLFYLLQILVLERPSFIHLSLDLYASSMKEEAPFDASFGAQFMYAFFHVSSFLHAISTLPQNLQNKTKHLVTLDCKIFM